MAQAILSENPYLASRYTVYIAGRDLGKAQNFIAQNALQANVIESLEPLDIQESVLLLCVKPKGLSNFTFKGKARCVYSAMAGVDIESLKAHIQSDIFVRFMPNIAARYKLSASAYYVDFSPLLTDMDSLIAQEICPFLESFGLSVRVDTESLIESSIATSGSSIAFLALVAEALIDAGVYEGLNHSQSAQLVSQTFSGFAKALQEQSPSALKYAISSPGGTTIRGLAVLEECGVRGAFMRAASRSAQHARDFKSFFSSKSFSR